MPLQPEDFVSLRDPALAAELLPGVPLPFIEEELGPYNCNELAKAVFKQTGRAIEDLIEDTSTKELIGFILNGADSENAESEAEEWAVRQGVDGKYVGVANWIHSHDGSRQQRTHDKLAAGGVVFQES